MDEVAPVPPDPYLSYSRLSRRELLHIIARAEALLRSGAWWGVKQDARVSRDKARRQLQHREA